MWYTCIVTHTKELKIIMLKRRKCSGFVDWPKAVSSRILSGSATFQTKCDLLVGPCSCGETHRESDECTSQILEAYDIEIEPMVLIPKEGVLTIPKYWSNVYDYNGRKCTTLLGPCNCGSNHVVDDRLSRLLALNNAEIQCLGRTTPNPEGSTRATFGA